MEIEQFKEVKQQLPAHWIRRVAQLPHLEAVIEAYRTRGIKSLYNWQAECLTTPGLWSLQRSGPEYIVSNQYDNHIIYCQLNEYCSIMSHGLTSSHPLASAKQWKMWQGLEATEISYQSILHSRFPFQHLLPGEWTMHRFSSNQFVSTISIFALLKFYKPENCCYAQLTKSASCVQRSVQYVCVCV